jgi:peptidoglycan/xylan/chitin deacetylase (PgdA/CDA1 family)
MYHSISDSTEPGVKPYYRTVTSPRRFAEQMRWLASAGYRGVTLSEGLEWLHESGRRSSEKPVVLTFDDGFSDFATAAVPVLQEFHFHATMFLPTAFIGKSAARRQFNGRDCMTWAEARRLQREGMEFGSHTVSHPKLVKLSWPEVESEVTNSKDEIEQQLGCAVPGFAYPYAFPQAHATFAARFGGLLRSTGYDACVTTEIGRETPGGNQYRIKRLPVNDADDAALLSAKLDGAYDWLAKPQGIVKTLKRTLLRR